MAESAQLAKEGGCAHFSLLTAAGAKADAWSCDFSPLHGLLYMKTKGMVRRAWAPHATRTRDDAETYVT